MERLQIDLSQPQSELKDTTQEAKLLSEELEGVKQDLTGLGDTKVNIDMDRSVDRAEKLAENLGHVTRVAAGLAGGVEVVQGALNLMGVESEEAEKAIQKMMAVMEITNGFSAIGDGIESFVKLGKVIKTSTLYSKLFSAEKKKETVVVNANTFAQKANAMAMKASAVAARGLKAALISSGIGALVVGLGYAIEKLVSLFSETNDELTDLSENDALNSFKDNITSASADIQNGISGLARYMENNSLSAAIKRENVELAQALTVMDTRLQQYATLLSRTYNGRDVQIQSFDNYLKTIKKGGVQEQLKNILNVNLDDIQSSQYAFSNFMLQLNDWITTSLHNVAGSNDEAQEDIKAYIEDLQGGTKLLIDNYTNFLKSIVDLDVKSKEKIDNILKEAGTYGLSNYKKALKDINDKRKEALELFENTAGETAEDRNKILSYYDRLAQDLKKDTENQIQSLYNTSGSLGKALKELRDKHNENLKTLKEFFDDRLISEKFYNDNKKVLNRVFESQRDIIILRSNIANLELDVIKKEAEVTIYKSKYGDKRTDELNELEKSAFIAKKRADYLKDYTNKLQQYQEAVEKGAFNVYKNTENGTILDREATNTKSQNFLLAITTEFETLSSNIEKEWNNTLVSLNDQMSTSTENIIAPEEALAAQFERRRTALIQRVRGGEDGIESLYQNENFVGAAERNLDLLQSELVLLEQYREELEKIGADTTDVDAQITENSIARTVAEKELMQAKIDSMNSMLDTFNSAAGVIIASGDAISSEWNNVFSNLQAGLNQIGQSLKTNGKGWQTYTQVVGSAFNVLGSTFGAIADEQNENTKEGFEKQKKFETAAAVMNTLGGIINVITSVWNPVNAWLTPWGQAALSASMSTALAVMGGIQIKKIKNTKFEGSGSGDVSSPNISAMASMQPAIAQANIVEGASIEGATKDTRVYVSETDISRVQNRVNVTETEAKY